MQGRDCSYNPSAFPPCMEVRCTNAAGAWMRRSGRHELDTTARDTIIVSGAAFISPTSNISGSKMSSAADTAVTVSWANQTTGIGAAARQFVPWVRLVIFVFL